MTGFEGVTTVAGLREALKAYPDEMPVSLMYDGSLYALDTEVLVPSEYELARYPIVRDTNPPHLVFQ